MTKAYNVKSNERLFNKWLKLVAQTNSRCDAMFIVQNDMTFTSDELNKWNRDLVEEIEHAEKNFKRIIDELHELRTETIDYIKSQVVEDD